MEKVKISVLRGCNFWGEGGELVETIMRKPWLEAIGNFNPMFCRYRGKRTLVNSMAGDISDWFRRDDHYLESLFIVIE